MHINSCVLKCLLAVACIVASRAALPQTVEAEAIKNIRAPDAVAKIGVDLFGDRVNLYNGGLEFVQNDFSIPGNSKLPVAISRRLVTGGAGNGGMGLFAHWDLELPSISGTFSSKFGWQTVDANGSATTARCSNFGAPPNVYQNTSDIKYRPAEYWHGNLLYIPGGGGDEVLKRAVPTSNNNVPTDGIVTPLVTKGLWAIRCLNTLSSTTAGSLPNETGEGFLAISPDGTTYQFDWLVSRPAVALSKPVGAAAPPQPEFKYDANEAKSRNEQFAKQIREKVQDDRTTLPQHGDGFAMFSMDRVEVSIFPTSITDRYGNTVRYTYDSSDKWKLKTISSSDGAGNSERTINLAYQPGSRLISSATDGTRTWTYTYGGGATAPTMLTAAILPDGSSWDFVGMDAPNHTGMLWMDIHYGVPPEPNSADEECDPQPIALNSPVVTGTMKHPSGATGSFTMTPTPHGRNGVPQLCYSDIGTLPAKAWYPRYYDSYALTKKSIAGPGLTTMEWNTSYNTFFPGWQCQGCPASEPSVVSVTNPKGEVTRYSFGNTWGLDEGLIKQVDIGWTGSSALRTTATRYNQTFSELVGVSAQPRGDMKVSARHIPVDKRMISQQGVDFIWEVPASADFDRFRRPLRVIKSSSLGNTRTEATSYHDNTAKWILGQIATVTDVGTGQIPVANGYNSATGSLETVSNFGRLNMTLLYHGDGNLASRQDGRNYTTSFARYKRGVPRLITHPDASTEAYVVNDIGAISAKTDQTGSTTLFGYDAMGRIESVAHPAGDTVAWNSTKISYVNVPSFEYDLEPGHWKQTVTVGNAQTINYFDALWRPVYTFKADSANPAATSSIVKKRFDHEGNVTFASYPQREYASIAGGVHSEYDALGRPTVTGTESELGVIFSGNYYGSGFATTSTSGRGIDIVYNFQAFDNPEEAAITGISAPLGVSVNIPRDAFGKPHSITRSGNGKSLTRTYVYDSAQRLCKTIEPEIGATVQDYDGANNVAWRASGLTLPSPTDCNTASVVAGKKIVFGYDPLNRLLSTSYGDASPGITRTYTPDGLVETVASAGTRWTYGYNRRRLNEVETLVYGGVDYRATRQFNANGSVAELTYPDNTTVDYLPNAFGEPTKVGPYATGITYHPSGAIKSFSYGNGIAHSLTQTVRQLPDRSIDVGVLNDVYAYDQNANVTSILDWHEGVTNRAMAYDELDRLKQIYAPAMWGDAVYSYDALDNLTGTSFNAGSGIARSMVHHFDPVTNRLTSLTGTAGFAMTYGYDAQGNVSQRGGQTYVYDQGNRMKEATGKATYIYDGWGRRTSVVGTDLVNRIQMYTQDGKLLYAGPTSSSAKTKYIYLHKHVIAEVGSTGTQYLHTDALGSPVARTSASGALISRTRYEPYGRTASGAGPTIGFTGHFNDIDTGLTYMQQRYYDPVAGRMLSVDPVTTDANSGGSFNRYAYSNNNPYKYVDPDGRNAITKLVKQTIKHDGNVVKAAADVIADVVTVVSPSSTPLDRLEAAISLVSPVDVSDVKSVKNFVDKAGAAKESGKSFSKEKQALVEMAKEDKKAGITPGDMQTYKNLNKDLPDPFPSNKVRGPEAHNSGAPSSREPHGHVGPVNHIPVKEP